MSDSSRVAGRRGRIGAPTARAAAAIVVTAGLAVLAAACGGSSGSPGAQSTFSSNAPAASAQQNGWLAFSGCMRSQGVPSYPDPEGSGPPPKKSLRELGVSSSQFQSALTACRHLLPNGGRPPNQAQRQQVRAQALRFSQCVRAHGVPNFPDPGSDGRIPDPATVGIDQGSPMFEAANEACGRYRPPYMPSNGAYNAWARTHTGSGS
jgi:hypothetical protein